MNFITFFSSNSVLLNLKLICFLILFKLFLRIVGKLFLSVLLVVWVVDYYSSIALLFLSILLEILSHVFHWIFSSFFGFSSGNSACSILWSVLWYVKILSAFWSRVELSWLACLSPFSCINIYSVPDYKDKWNSMLYRVLKAILGINHNIKKEDLPNTMSVNTKDKDKSKKFFINLLSINALKLKLRCLFHKYSKKKIWDCEQINDNNHWITVWKISTQWRKKWDTIWYAALGKNFIEMLNKSYMVRSNQKKVALIINKAVEELIDIYSGKGEVSRILLFWN